MIQKIYICEKKLMDQKDCALSICALKEEEEIQLIAFFCKCKRTIFYLTKVNERKNIFSIYV